MVEITVCNGHVLCPKCGQVAKMVEHYHDGWAEYQCTDRECGEVFDVDDPDTAATNTLLDRLADDADALLSMTEHDREDMRDMEWEREAEDYIAQDLGLPTAIEEFEDYAYLLPRLD